MLEGNIGVTEKEMSLKFECQPPRTVLKYQRSTNNPDTISVLKVLQKVQERL